MQLSNSILVSFTAPPTPDARGGRTGGATTAYPPGTRAAVGAPRRSQLISQLNKIADCTAVVYMPAVGPVPQIGGRLAWRMDGDGVDQAGIVLATTHWVRGPGDAHYEVFAKAV